jgi:hypothetical protein
MACQEVNFLKASNLEIFGRAIQKKKKNFEKKTLVKKSSESREPKMPFTPSFFENTQKQVKNCALI